MSGVDAITSCPKCGFEQPVDTYCAKCGVDMTSVPKKTISIAKQPALIGGIAVFAIIVTFAGVRAMRGDEKTSAALASEVGQSKSVRREHLSGQASESVAENMRQNLAAQQQSGEAPQPAPAQADVHFHASHEQASATTAPSVSTGATTGAKTMSKAPATKSTQDAALAKPALVIAFAWTEVSREWLQAMGALEPGLHRVPDLEARLRESAGSYRIVEVDRHQIEDNTTSIALTRGNRISLHLQLTDISENSFSGSMQTSYRMPDGAVRAPAAAALTIEKGQGSIMTLSGPGTGPGPNPTGAEIVVLILPRWGADRNP